MIVLEIAAIIFLFALFGLSHTILASRKLKFSIAQKVGDKIAFYRFFYNASSILLFVVFYELSPKPDAIIYDLHYPFDIITFAIQVLCLFGLLISVKPINLGEFIGYNQIVKYLKGEYDPEYLDEQIEFRKEGMFKIVRHPIYLFSILFLGSRPSMDVFYFVMFICIVVYFYIGSIYEERKLVNIFGSEYEEYRKNTPRLLPFKIMRHN